MTETPFDGHTSDVRRAMAHEGAAHADAERRAHQRDMEGELHDYLRSQYPFVGYNEEMDRYHISYAVTTSDIEHILAEDDEGLFKEELSPSYTDGQRITYEGYFTDMDTVYAVAQIIENAQK